MRNSTRNLLGIGVIVGFTILLATSLKTGAPSKNDVQKNNPGEEPSAGRNGRTRIATLPGSDTARPSATVRPVRAPRTPASDTTSSLPYKAPVLTGYVVDRFQGMDSLPAGYMAENVELTQQGLTLPAGGELARVGILESPPLPLREPATPLPVPRPRELPDGTSIQVEISLSHDGKGWSEWYLVERNTPGSSDQDGGAGATASDPITYVPPTPPDGKPPLIRYRITLTAQGAKAPVLHDLRIWRRAMSADADDLNREIEELSNAGEPGEAAAPTE